MSISCAVPQDRPGRRREQDRVLDGGLQRDAGPPDRPGRGPAQPFAWDRNDEQSPGEDPFFSLPVIFDIGGAPRIFFVGWYIRDASGTSRHRG
jgi:hypothetical protein